MINQYKNHKNIHKKKEYYTLMFMSSPTKAPRTISIPKWTKYPTFFVVFIVAFMVLGIGTHLTRLEVNLSQQKKLVNELTIQADNYQKEIETLQIANKDQYNQLRHVMDATHLLQEELINLAEHKVDLNQKLSTIERTTDDSLEEIEIELTRIDHNRDFTYASNSNLGTSTTLKMFDNDLKALEDMLDGLYEQVDLEINTFINLDKQVEDLLPYWEAYPSILPVDGRISSNFGWRRNPFGGGSYEFHSGVDLAVTYNTPVKATGKGTVIHTGYDRFSGNLVIIDHGYGITTKYAHNNSIRVSEGDIVERGEVIADSGSTGRSTGPHVHYEVLLNNEPQNPLDYLYEGE
ncbi:peptidase M23-like protein [Natranaerovirga hydrolytica]|uniref:Peptidase M23-like protein n=1 Tax=Natranaerovirga hydrolytica TaxID=680378 RepID=A0A4R1MBZ6_9FIRM|nr:M23 family metallopeptidase [Natranaerovirga hydrolytica]TCK89040.1 peptidase M23-like protein [Natranaerovirga hydrolytica]